MDGLKKRWFTERTSTLTRPPPTTPSAAPNPVMLRIISSSVSYGGTTRLSIPEIPSDTGELCLSRHLKAGYQRVPLLEQIAELVRDDRGRDSDLDPEGEGADVIRSRRRVARQREAYARSVFVRERRQEAEVSPGEAIQQVGLDVQLGAGLVARTVVATTIRPGDAPRIRMKRLEQPAADRDRARRGFALGSHGSADDAVLDQLHWREQRRRATPDQPTADPEVPESHPRLRAQA